ncbi:DNA cytosine methyltransferase [Microbacterium lacticum]|uniref:DNA cytosine methyltransferase n=1 Tax=Microbacterium lacticum TaxID=33885 RepID=UPI003A8AB3FC
MHDDQPQRGRPLRVGSLFSGYGGLDLAVEYATDGETIWFSEINTPSIRVYAHHWPGIPNLGDISTTDWATVPPVDVLMCQDVSTVGKGAGLAPGTRSGLWSHMATAIDALQPELVVIENVRGLLSAPAIPLPFEHPRCTQPRRCNQRARNRRSQPGTRGCWETSQADLFEHTEPFSGIWPTSANCAMDRPTGVPGRRTTSPVPGFHHRLPPGHCSGRPGLGLLTRRRDPGPGTGATASMRGGTR